VVLVNFEQKLEKIKHNGLLRNGREEHATLEDDSLRPTNIENVQGSKVGVGGNNSYTQSLGSVYELRSFSLFLYGGLSSELIDKLISSKKLKHMSTL
jgi:hypothetical protein